MVLQSPAQQAGSMAQTQSWQVPSSHPPPRWGTQQLTSAQSAGQVEPSSPDSQVRSPQHWADELCWQPLEVQLSTVHATPSSQSKSGTWAQLPATHCQALQASASGQPQSPGQRVQFSPKSQVPLPQLKAQSIEQLAAVSPPAH